MAKVLCVLYDDPVDGYPKSYARDDIPVINSYPGGQTTPSPEAVDFTPGQLLGSVSGELGLRQFLEQAGHTLVVTSDKEGPDSVFDRELPDADVVISQPFWPAYLTRERIARAKNLKLAITAGIGSDHVDLQAASEAGMTVAEVTYSNSISVSEHVIMMILALVRNYIPSYGWVVRGGWNIADCVERSYDLEGMTVGSVAAGRIGTAVLKRLKPFDVKLAYTDPHRLPQDTERELGLTFYETPAQLVPHCDVVTINAPPLLPVFRSRLQGDLLALVLGGPAAEWTAEELSQRTGHPRHTVANELRRLEEAGVFTARIIGRSKLTRANTDNPYYEPLSRLALMSFGPPQVIREELGTIDHVEQLFIFGSWAARYAGEQGPAPHDVDVLIIGAPDRDEVYEAARRAQERLGREVNTTIRKAEQWQGAQDGFARQVRSSPLVQIPLPSSDR